MEGSGFPDLESVRVRRVNSEKCFWGLIIEIQTCALCKIYSFVVEGTTWSTRATWSSWPTWSCYSRHKFGFWGNWPTRKRWRTWPACKCRCINTHHLILSDSLGYCFHSDERHLNEVFWIVGVARFTRNWWFTRTDRSQRRKGKWCSNGHPDFWVFIVDSVNAPNSWKNGCCYSSYCTVLPVMPLKVYYILKGLVQHLGTPQALFWGRICKCYCYFVIKTI